LDQQRHELALLWGNLHLPHGMLSGFLAQRR
jgi:hypothetical protein